MKRNVVKKMLVCIITVLLLVSIATLTASAASYPLLSPDEFRKTAYVGDTVALKYTYFPEYKNEKITIYVYDENENQVASSERNFYHTDYMLTYTVDWDTTGYDPGEYTVVAHKYFYTFNEWYEAPTPTTSYVILKSATYCESGSHEFSYYTTKTEATCANEGLKERECKNCPYVEQEVIPKTDHSYSVSSYGTADCTNQGYTEYVCICGDKYQNTVPALGHDYVGTVITESTCSATGTMEMKCSRCSAKYNEVIPKKEHSFSEWITTVEPTCTVLGKQERRCTVCSYTEEITLDSSSGHSPEILIGYAATCTESGMSDGKQCSACGLVLEAQNIIPATGHDYVEKLFAATVSENGQRLSNCQNCNASIVETIRRISSIKLSSTKVTYNGKVRTPSVIVTDSSGTKLVKDTDYTVDYEGGRKNPGVYIITVTFMGEYEGEEELEFTIAPKATTGVKAKAKTATSITLTWTKTTGATGYRVYQYSPSKGKYVLKKSVKGTNTYKVTGLKKGTSYKFKVRPYTKEEDGTVIWGSYSSVYSVKTTNGYSVELSGSSATMYVGKTKQLKATTNPAGKSVTWKSSNKSVATVSSTGKVTAKKAGTATITVTFKYKGETCTDTYKITVKPSLSSNKTNLKFTSGSTAKKSVSITFIGSGSIRWEKVKGEDLITCQWADKWDENNTIKLYISPKSNEYGEARVKVYSTENPKNFVYIDVVIEPPISLTVINELPCIVGNKEADDYYDKGEKESKVKITKVDHEVLYGDSLSITVEFVAQDSYYDEGYYYFTYRILDEEGYVVEFDRVMSERMYKGDKSKEEIYLYDIGEGNYTIEFIDHYASY